MKFSRQLRMPAAALAFLLSASGVGSAQESDQLPATSLTTAKPTYIAPLPSKSSARAAALAAPAAVPAATPAFDTVGTFNGSFNTPGFDANNNPNNHWLFDMLGNAPQRGGTTVFNAPVVPVSVLLLNQDGTPRFVNGQILFSDASQFVPKLLQSPLFDRAEFESSRQPTQITDAVQRAEFFKQLGDGDRDRDDRAWHTLLSPTVKASRVMAVPFGSYAFAVNTDGSCCSFIEVDLQAFEKLLFPATSPVDGTTLLGAAELDGDITTKDVSTFLFNNVYLFENHNPANCCILGFHSIDDEPGDATNGNLTRRFVFNYSSWITAGLFGTPNLQDITATSHEIAETFNDPFVVADGVTDLTPWWLSPNGNCQDDLEVGDVVEGLPNSAFPVKLNGFTYHPQNEALLQWFEFQSPSTAIHGAYTFPDTTVITALSPVEHANCK